MDRPPQHQLAGRMHKRLGDGQQTYPGHADGEGDLLPKAIPRPAHAYRCHGRRYRSDRAQAAGQRRQLGTLGCQRLYIHGDDRHQHRVGKGRTGQGKDEEERVGAGRLGDRLDAEPDLGARHRGRPGVARLPNDHDDDNGRHDHQRRGDGEHRAVTEGIRREPAQEGPQGVRHELRHLQRAERAAEVGLRRARGHERHRGGDCSAEHSLDDTEDDELRRRGGHTHQEHDDRCRCRRADQHDLAPEAVGQAAPYGCGDHHGEHAGGLERRCPRHRLRIAVIRHALQIVGDE